MQKHMVPLVKERSIAITPPASSIWVFKGIHHNLPEFHSPELVRFQIVSKVGPNETVTTESGTVNVYAFPQYCLGSASPDNARWY